MNRRLGRLPHDPDRPVLRLGRYLTGRIPDHPVFADYLSEVTDWGLYGNDRYGVCGPTAVANQRKQVSAYLSGAEQSPSQEDVFDLYRRSGNPVFDPITGSGDNGVVLADMLSALLSGGIGGARPLAYAAVNVDDPDEVRAAIALFGSLLFGVDLDAAQDDQTEHGQAWDYVRRSRDWGGHCLAPGTRVLTDDLQWAPIEEIRPGDGLIGFDEFATPGVKRKYRRAVVQSTETIDLPCYELEFEDGTTVVASEDHLWFVTSKKNGGWLRTDQMRVCGPGGQYGTKVRKLAPLWEQDMSRDAGYLAAAFDGEGWIDSGGKAPNGSARGTKKVGFTQRENVMWEKVTYELKARGYDFHCWDRQGSTQQNGNSCMNLTLSGRMQFLHFLGSIRPHRLLERFYPERLGSLAEEGGVALVRKTFIGQHPVVALGTSTGTFIAEGLASHNCVLAGAYTSETDRGDIDISVISWGERVGTTDAFCAHQLQEAWVVIWPEVMGTEEFADGVDLAALAADYEALTGRPFPSLPAPDPTPTPPPLPVPVPPGPEQAFRAQLAAFVADAQRWLSGGAR